MKAQEIVVLLLYFYPLLFHMLFVSTIKRFVCIRHVVQIWHKSHRHVGLISIGFYVWIIWLNAVFYFYPLQNVQITFLVSLTRDCQIFF